MESEQGRVSLPVGIRFHPTDEELVDHDLKRKMEDEDFEDSNIVSEIDVCKYDPWDLPALLLTEPDSPFHDMEWFFFSPRNYKYANSTRSNRATPNGYWKITGMERMIRARRSKAVIGKKRIMTFYKRCQSKLKKTNWVMHQYNRIESLNPMSVQRDFVLCRMKHISDKKDTTICDGSEPRTTSMNFENVDTLNGSNFKRRKEEMELLMTHLEYDIAINEEEPAELAPGMKPDDVDKRERWEKANKMCITTMRRAMTTTERGGILTTEKARDYMKAIAEEFKEDDKVETRNLLTQLAHTKFEGNGSVRKHFLKRSDIAGKLSDLEITNE